MKNLIISLLITLPFFLFGQSERETARIRANQKAHSQIVKLKSGVLLVRLYDKHNVVEALKAKGMEKRAQAIINKQKELNKEIASSFAEFNFCKVYFFYSGQSTFLINGELSKVDLYNSDLVLMRDTKLKGEYLVADFGMMNDEAPSRTETEQKPQSGISDNKKYTGSNTSTNIRTMYLRDNKLVQLSGPFPYYVRFHPNPIKSRSYQEVVEKMNQQLTDFYNSK